MRLHLLSFILTFGISANALSAISGSPCYSTCRGDNATTSNDIVCTDSDFSTTSKGQLFKKCMVCLENSTYNNGARSDATLFLFYLSTVQEICLSSGSSILKANCGSKCAGVDSSFTQTGPEFFASPYAYCSTNNTSYENVASKCAPCLQTQGGTMILGNFVQVGYDACQTQANVTNGDGIPVNGDIFNGTVDGGSMSFIGTSAGGNGTATATQAATSTAATGQTSSGAVVRTSVASSMNTSPHATSSTVTGLGSSGDENSPTSGKSSLSPGAAAAIGILVGASGVAGIIALALLARRRQQSAWQRMRSHRDFPDKSVVGHNAAASFAMLATPAPVVAEKSSTSFKPGRMLSRASEWSPTMKSQKSAEAGTFLQRHWQNNF